MWEKERQLSCDRCITAICQQFASLQSVTGIQVIVSVPKSHYRNMGKIKDVPLKYGDAELLEHLQECAVISARRQIAYAPQPNGNIQALSCDFVMIAICLLDCYLF